MSDAVIQVDNLWKEYRLGVISHRTLSHDLQSWWAKIRGKEDPNTPIDNNVAVPQKLDERFWALQDVSFEVKRGDTLGIIGRNGAGKSTLLKILSQVTVPTRGEVRFNGRIASLLEVGTGFHPELTGRENIFLNGAILGMSKVDIRNKFDEIIAFAEVDRFIDTPVKRYSSGMYVRLAFAVAAHLEPEILIIDEVLAVGDAQFQKKCLGKIEAVGNEGRTVLFVSHNITAVRSLCNKALWIDNGRLLTQGPTLEVSEEYLKQSLTVTASVDITALLGKLSPDPILQIEGISLQQKGAHCDVILNGEPLEVEIRYRVLQRTSGLRVYFDLCDDEKNILVRTFNDEEADVIPVVEPGHYISKAIIPAHLLAPKKYEIRVFGTIYNVRSIPPGGIGVPIQVESSGGINRAYPYEPIRSKLQPRIHWDTEKLEEIV